MATALASQLALCWETFVVLLLGGALIVVAGGLLAWRQRSAPWQRTIWRAAIVAILGLVVAELAGVGRSAATHLGLPRRSGSPIDVAPLAVGLCTLADAATTYEPSRFMVQASIEPAPLEFADAAAGDAVIASREHRSGPPTKLPANRATIPASSALTEAAPGEWLGLSPVWLATAFALVWLGGAIALLLDYLRSLIKLYKAAAGFRPIEDAELLATFTALAAGLGLRRGVELVECPRLTGPSAVGVLRPRVVVPVGFGRQFTLPQQQAVLAHELTHLAAGDLVWQAVARLAMVLLWWHPAVWLARRELKAASEAAADETSLLIPGGPTHLAESLVELGRRLVRRERLGWLALEGNGFRSGLGKRVDRLLKLSTATWRPPSRSRMLSAMTLLPVVCLCVVVLCTGWVRAQPVEPQSGEEPMNILSTTWRGSLAAALWTMLGPTAAPAMADEPNPPSAKPAITAEGQGVAAEAGLRVRLDRERRVAELRAMAHDLDAAKRTDEAEFVRGQIRTVEVELAQANDATPAEDPPAVAKPEAAAKAKLCREAAKKLRELSENDAAEALEEAAEQIEAAARQPKATRIAAPIIRRVLNTATSPEASGSPARVVPPGATDPMPGVHSRGPTPSIATDPTLPPATPMPPGVHSPGPTPRIASAPILPVPPPAVPTIGVAAPAPPADAFKVAQLTNEVEALRAEIRELRALVKQLAEKQGEKPSDPSARR